MRKLITALLLPILFVCALCATTQAFAQSASIRGLIDTSSGTFNLRTKTGALYAIETSNSVVRADLARLNQGDFLVARGTLDEGTKKADIEAIESLGLKHLIGTWSSSSRQEYYEFRDFSRLNLYVPDSARKKVEIAGQYHYVIAPDRGGRYSIFLSDNRSVLVGSFELRAGVLQLKVLDPKTGRVSQNISLSPLSVK